MMTETNKSGLRLGVTGIGKTNLLGIMKAADEAAGIMSISLHIPETEAAKSERMLRETQEAARAAERLSRIRTMVWLDIEGDDGDGADLSELIELSLDGSTVAITEGAVGSEQRRAVIALFDRPLLGEIVKWGVSDSEARQSISEFIEENTASVLEALDRARQESN